MNVTRTTQARILIVDDHPLVRYGFTGLLNDQPGLEVCGEAATADQALQMIGQLSPHLAIIDLALGQQSGLELIKEIKSRFPQVIMLVVSMQDEILFAERALRAGAMGYLSKEVAPERVVEAIYQVLRGEVYVSPSVASRMLQSVVAGQAASNQSPIASLTDRELEVFRLIGRGFSTREIANQLDLSIKTIETYREHIKAKLSVHNASELMRHAVQWVLENG